MDFSWSNCLFLESIWQRTCLAYDDTSHLDFLPSTCCNQTELAVEGLAGIRIGACSTGIAFLVPDDAVPRSDSCSDWLILLMASKQKVLAIVGPTCTGKTALSIRIAKELGGEIICADSRTIYKYFDIGTAKPTEEERQGVPHHLIDVADPAENFTAAQFRELGAKAIEEISSRNKLPIVCGGTGFYTRALLEGLSIPAVPPQEELRKQLACQADEKGNDFIFEKLCQLDPETAIRLNPNDRFRVIRALEVCLTTGKRFSELAGTRELPYETMWIGLTVTDRSNLRALIEKRLAEQMQMGMLEEVKNLLAQYGRSQKIMNTVNYRDLTAYLAGEQTMENALEGAVRHNYQLARRQMMWFKSNPEMNWFYTDETAREKISEEILGQAREFWKHSK